MDCERKDTGWVGTSVKMLADLLLLFPPAASPPTPGQDIENKNSSYLMKVAEALVSKTSHKVLNRFPSPVLSDDRSQDPHSTRPCNIPYILLPWRKGGMLCREGKKNLEGQALLNFSPLSGTLAHTFSIQSRFFMADHSWHHNIKMGSFPPFFGSIFWRLWNAMKYFVY